MIFNVNFSNKATFIKSASNVKRKTFNADGELIEESDYKAPFLPKVGRMYTPHRSGNKILIDMSQTELDALVLDMQIYDNNNNQIVRAPIGNPGAPFWSHPKASVWLENSGTSFDDTDVFGKFFLACFRADPEFRISTEDQNPAMDAKTKFTVTNSADAISEKDKNLDEVAKAMEMLVTMDFDTRVKILNAMGVSTTNPSPEQVVRALTEKVTTQKDKLLANGERNIELYFRLAGAPSEETNIRALITKAKDPSRRVIVKAKDGYVYGALVLGRTLDDVYQFLSNKDNKDTLADIAKSLGDDLFQ